MKRIVVAMLFALMSSIAMSTMAQDTGDLEATYGISEADVERLEENPADFYEQSLTVDGYAEEIVGPNSFILQNYEPFDLTPGDFLVIDATNSSFVDLGADIDQGQAYRITGTFWNYDFDAVQTELGYELDEDLFGIFDDEDYVLIAESAEAIDEADGFFSLDDDDEIEDGDGEVISSPDVVENPEPGVSTDDLGDENNQGFGIYDQRCNAAYVGENFLGLENEMTEQIEDDPTDFFGTTVTIEGYVDQVLETGFILRDNEPFDFSPPDFVVVDPQSSGFGDLEIDLDDNLCVTGTVYPVDAEEIQSELTVTIDEGFFSDFDTTSDDFAMVAENVSILDDEGGILDGYTISDDDEDDMDMDDDIDGTVTGVYDEACSNAYAGENFLGLETEMTELIEDNPAEFLGTSVTIEGYVDQVLANGFILQDNEPFDFTPPDFVVVEPQDDGAGFGDLSFNEDDNLCVTGTVYPIDAQEIQNDLEYTLDEGYFDQFNVSSDDFALVAENISVLDEEGAVTNDYTYDDAMGMSDDTN